MNEAAFTGIGGIDDAMRSIDPVPGLTDHFRLRIAERGREAALADLRRAVAASPEGSPAHDWFQSWLQALERGENHFG